MSSAPTAAPYPTRRATRDSQEPIIGGVAAGLARHLALPVVWVRAGFLVTVFLGGLGIMFYAGLWLVLPADTRFGDEAPGLASASRGGRRPGRMRRLGDVGPAIALAALGFGAVLSLEAVFGRGVILWPVLFAVVGIGLLWRQADEAQRERWLDSSGRIDPVRIVFGSGGWAAYARVAVGVLLVATGFFVFGFDSGSLQQARGAVIAGGLGMLGVGLVVGPWLFRLASDLTAEREERVRSQERADVAAHLHDSVLQTLALIQKSADDGPTVARLARAQERDLRAWLYSGEATDERTLASAVRGAAAEVEDAHGVSVDVVAVGDCDFDEALRPLVAATREAVTNAAKHAGTGRVDVYVEVGEAAVDVFVRDRGAGFDPESVPADRHGVRHSILDRMHRHGGTATVRSTPGEGTEVRLHLPRPTAASAAPAADRGRDQSGAGADPATDPSSNASSNQAGPVAGTSTGGST